MSQENVGNFKSPEHLFSLQAGPHIYHQMPSYHIRKPLGWFSGTTTPEKGTASYERSLGIKEEDKITSRWQAPLQWSPRKWSCPISHAVQLSPHPQTATVRKCDDSKASAHQVKLIQVTETSLSKVSACLCPIHAAELTHTNSGSFFFSCSQEHAPHSCCQNEPTASH